MNAYPQRLRDWISRRGGLSPRLIYLSGEEPASMYPRRDGSKATATADWHSEREHGRSKVSVEHSQSVSAARAATTR